MRNFSRRVTTVGLIALLLSPMAALASGMELSEPSLDDARAKLERLLSSALLSKYSIATLEGEGGRTGEMLGHKTYEMRFFAAVNYSDDKLRCRVVLCPELQNFVVKVDEARKKATIAGWLFFEHTKEGWQ